MDNNENTLSVEVVYALPQQCMRYPLNVKPGTTVQQVIEQSGVLDENANIDLSINEVGIFGKKKDLQHRVKSGDRVEIYRPLIIDPKQARRLRAEKQKQSET